MKRQFEELLAVVRDSAALLPVIEQTGEKLSAILAEGGTIFTCGNGGSAADALHLAEELTGRYRKNRAPLAGLCLAADPTALTCIANDYGFEEVFARPLQALGRTGDCVVAFSTSGNSANIVRALKVARTRGLQSILLCGRSGGEAAPYADIVVAVPSGNSARIQEIHTFILHCWLESIEADLAETSS